MKKKGLCVSYVDAHVCLPLRFSRVAGRSHKLQRQPIDTPIPTTANPSTLSCSDLSLHSFACSSRLSRAVVSPKTRPVPFFPEDIFMDLGGQCLIITPNPKSKRRRRTSSKSRRSNVVSVLPISGKSAHFCNVISLTRSSFLRLFSCKETHQRTRRSQGRFACFAHGCRGRHD